MRRRILLVLLALLTVPLGAQSPAPLQVPYQQFKLANGLNVILHRDTEHPGRGGEHLVLRRLRQREAGTHRVSRTCSST